jgi:hypothetical protein
MKFMHCNFAFASSHFYEYEENRSRIATVSTGITNEVMHSLVPFTFQYKHFLLCLKISKGIYGRRELYLLHFICLLKSASLPM